MFFRHPHRATNKPIFPVPLPTLLRISLNGVHEQHFTEYEHQDCPTFAILPPSPGGVGKVVERFSATDVCKGCRPTHANGAVDEEIDSIKQFDLRNKRGYTVLYAFTARNRHHVRVARARQPAGRGHVDRAPMLASSQLRSERIADAGSSRRVAPWHLAWCLSSHILP